MHNTRFAILCLAAVVRSSDAAAPEDDPDGGAKADMLLQVRSGGRAQQAAREDAPLKEPQPHHRYGCDKFTDRTRIRNDEVEHELSYAQTGSEIPGPLQGLFWMDQRGRNVNPAATGSSYRQSGGLAADELVVAFGDASWDPRTRCYSMPPFGGRKGRWTWFDQDGQLDNIHYNVLCGCRAKLELCCRGSDCHHIDLATYVHAADAGEYLSSHDFHGLGWFGEFLMGGVFAGLHMWNGHSEYFPLPTQIQSWQMVKTSWGFDRLSIDCPLCHRWFQTHHHYPVFRIVDGDGQRTEHYEAYLRFANEDTDAQQSTFQQPMNRGNGTTFVGRARG